MYFESSAKFDGVQWNYGLEQMTVQTFRAFLSRLSYNLNAGPYFASRDCYISRQVLLLHRRSACNEQLQMLEPAPVAHIRQRDRIESLKAAYHYSGEVWKNILQALYELSLIHI